MAAPSLRDFEPVSELGLFICGVQRVWVRLGRLVVLVVLL